MDLGQELLGIDDLRTKEVKVPRWKRTVTIQELGLQESMLAYGSLKPDDEGEVTLTAMEIAQFVAYGVIDPETGERAFSDDDVPVLARKSIKALRFLHSEIIALSGSVEDEVKN